MANDILMIDDDQDLNEIVGMYLNECGMDFRSISLAYLWQSELDKKIPDLIILDIEMPGINGFELCTQIREFNEDIPIIFLTNHFEVNNRIQAFQRGGNDFLAKPFSLEELKLRIVARLKDKMLLSQKKRFVFGEVILDLQERQIWIHHKSVVLTAIELEIFRLLASHPQTIYNEKDIYAAIWKEHYNQDTRMVNVHISNLRKKLESLDTKHKYIHTVWGKGYQYIG